MTCPICQAVTSDLRAHLDWHADRSARPVQRVRRRVPEVPAHESVTVDIAWASNMPAGYSVWAWVDAPIIGILQLAVADLSPGGCSLTVTPEYDIVPEFASVLDATAFIPPEETPDGD